MRRFLPHGVYAGLRRFISRRRSAYVQVFSGPHGRLVLEDLARFCRANESTFHADPRIAGQLDGRREVFLRIQQHLDLSPDQVFDLLVNAEPISTVEQEDFGDE